MKRENKGMEMSVKCGNCTDDLDVLENLCRKKAEELVATIAVSDNEVVKVAFWTNGLPELIGVGYFSRDKEGNIQYDLDFSESTL